MQRCHSRFTAVLALALIAALGTGCASTANLDGDARDPWESRNRSFYAFNDALDRHVMAPVADAYLKLPAGFRNSVHNFFENTAYPGTIINQLLQGKVLLALEDSARFVFNSTFGVGGLFDVSSGFGFEKHDEDFGQTLAVWGMDEGNHIHYPFFGPNSVRDTPGLIVSTFTDVLFYIGALPIGIIDTIDTRARLTSAIKLRNESALDPYVYTREAYRQRRTHLIYDGDPPIEEIDEDLDTTAQAAAQ